jgi:hypothetical protein
MERDQHGNPARSDQSAYEAYKAQYAKAAELREVFEKMVNDTVALPEGKRMAISYRFGKISMAVADVEPAKVSRKAVTLAALAPSKVNARGG